MIHASYQEIRENGKQIFRLDISGHAGYEDKGKDIVCAAVSVLFYTGIRSFEKVSDEEPSVKTDYCLDPAKAYLVITCRDDDTKNMEKIRTIYDTITTGISEVSGGYPEYVELSK